MSCPFDFETLSSSINSNKVQTKCPNCNEDSTSTCAILNVPHFKELLLMLFNCDSCGYRDNEIQGNGVLQPKGVKFILQVEKLKDINRQIVLSTFSTVSIVDIEFEFPKSGSRSVITTIEGLISSAITDLSDYCEQLTVELNSESKNVADKIHNVIKTLSNYILGDLKFTLVLDDPSGNSYIEQLPDTFNLKKMHYQRTDEQTRAMGYSTGADDNCSNGDNNKDTLDLNVPLDNSDEPPLFELQANCPNCGYNGNNKICKVQVPGFQECIIFSFNCSNCGAKSNEVKPGGPVSEFGQKWQLEISQPEDLNRELILSDFASLSIPSIDFVMMAGSIGGVFTTVEGILLKIAEHLETSSPFTVGDSCAVRDGLGDCCKKLRNIASLGAGDTIMVLDDPAGKSFISFLSPDCPSADLRLKVDQYKRSLEQDEELGLLDMQV